ncbi:MAG: EAL domain-containing protein [Acidimicrobiales bacterium]
MRADADPSLGANQRALAIRRGLDLPAASPATVIIGAADPDLARTVERAAAHHANAIDLRGSRVRLLVDNGYDFLERVLDTVPVERHNDVRLAFANPDASAEQLISLAINAADLEDFANRVERAHLLEDPPRYEVRYQPVLAMADRTIVGYESLLRATAGSLVIDAEELIARAARGNWTAELDHLGRTLALRGLGPWLGEGLLFLNVMAPGGRFDEPAVHATIDAAESIGIDPDQIVLEAVERNRYADLHDAARQLESFRRRGVRIAVDDVGDGYAGLRVLSAFSPDIIKIAGQLVADLAPPDDDSGGLRSLIPGPSNGNGDTSPKRPRSQRADAGMAESIVGTLVELAHKSGAWVVAENIETERQFRRLANLNVDWGQGLFLGAPSHR